MSNTHNYKTSVTWTGNKGSGTSEYRAYSRDHIIKVDGKHEILASSDPAFRGDSTRYNPEEMFIASLSTCHMLWFLHLCADAGIIVTEYKDEATGSMIEDEYGGRFQEVILRPQITITDETKRLQANELHHKAHKFCFIANSVKCEVNIEV